MPLEIKDEVAWALFGTGDIAFAGLAEQHGDRRYLAFQHHAPGEIGHEDDVGREFPIKDGWTPGDGGPCVAFEFDNVESFDQVVALFQEFRAKWFPDAGPPTPGGRPVRNSPA